MARFMGLAGVLVFLGLALLMSRDRKSIHWRTIGWALVLQWIFAVIVLKGDLIAGTLTRVVPWPGLVIGHKFYGLGWGVLLLMFTPLLLKRFAAYQNRRLNWSIFGAVVFTMLWGNLVGKTFNTMREVVEHLMACLLYTSPSPRD